MLSYIFKTLPMTIFYLKCHAKVMSVFSVISGHSTGLVVFVNCISAKLASFCINFFTVAKLVALVIIIIVGFIQLIKGNLNLKDNGPVKYIYKQSIQTAG